MKTQKNKHSKSIKTIKGINLIKPSLCILLAIYLGMSIYFMNHFSFGSVICDVNVSGKSVEKANRDISSKLDAYKIKLEGRDGYSEDITSSEIGLSYNADKIKELKNNQNAFGWIFSIFKSKNTENSSIISFDENLLKEKVDNLNCFSSKDIINPKNAGFEYTDNGYEVVQEIKGNKVNKEQLFDSLKEAISNGEEVFNLDEKNSYENPEYTSESEKILDTQKLLDKYTSTQITYTIGKNKEILDGSTIKDFIEINDDLEVTINKAKVKNYVYKLASKYNTFGSTRDFLTAEGKSIKVSGGNYGWIINNPQETEDIISTIKEGQTVTKEPKYEQTAVSRDSNDIGNTYVEIDLTKQHIWFYKNGSLIVESDVVTGNASLNWSTPPGVYRLTYKERNATLKGENYTSPVNYWMPFNGNIGIHDAGWRSEFGKEIYLTNGSHGCVNAPPDVAKTIFENIEEATPIVCYTE